MRTLVVSSACAPTLVSLVSGGDVLAHRRIDEATGLAAALPIVVAEVLAHHEPPELIAVVVGPGSFTSLRAGMSVAIGVALGLGVPCVGVTVAEAFAQAAGNDMLDGRVLWTALGARRGRVFIDAGGRMAGYDLDRLPAAQGRFAVCGNAANAVCGALAAKGVEIMLTNLRIPDPACVAHIAQDRAAGRLPPLQAVPLYVDAPQAMLPTGGLRASPVT